VAVIEKNRDGLPQPGCGQDQIKSIITVHIAHGDLQATGRSDNENRLSPSRAELKLDPVVCKRGVASPDLNSSEVRAAVPIKVGEGKRQASSGRRRGRALKICTKCRG